MVQRESLFICVIVECIAYTIVTVTRQAYGDCSEDEHMNSYPWKHSEGQWQQQYFEVQLSRIQNHSDRFSFGGNMSCSKILLKVTHEICG